jgi:hypothetical protein
MPICQQPPPACIAGRQAGRQGRARGGRGEAERETGRDREGDRERYRTNSELEGVAHEDGKGLKVRVP